MVSKRIDWLDVAKGLLILMVVYGHLQDEISKMNIQSKTIHWIADIQNIWAPFFMSAFFVVTGYCFSIKRGIKDFLIIQLKTILLPAFTIRIFISILSKALGGNNSVIESIMFTINTFLKEGGPYWFLWALFVCKIANYFLLRKYSLRVVFIIGIILFFISSIGYEFFPAEKPFLRWQRCLAMMPFIPLGLLLKKYEHKFNLINSLVFVGIYIIVFYLCKYYIGAIPKLVGEVPMMLVDVIPSIILSITGSLSFLFVCKKISRWNLIEYLGRNTLVIYLIHNFILTTLLIYFRPVIEQDLTKPILCTEIVIIISTIVITMMINEILNTRYLKILIGKF